MLQELEIHPTIPVSDMARARGFYEGKLGLKGKETPAGIMYNCGGNTWFLLFESGGAGKSSSTWAGWQAEDLEGVVKKLQDNGVKFEEYDNEYIKTSNGIATTPVGQAAWFKDTEGNTLGIVKLNK